MFATPSLKSLFGLAVTIATLRDGESTFEMIYAFSCKGYDRFREALWGRGATVTGAQSNRLALGCNATF